MPSLLLVTVPFTGVLKLVMIKLAVAVSASLSLALMLKVLLPSSVTVAASFKATGVLFTAVIVIDTVTILESTVPSLMV